MNIFGLVITTRKRQLAREQYEYNRGLSIASKILLPVKRAIYSRCPEMTEESFHMSKVVWNQIGDCYDSEIQRGGKLPD